MTKYRLKDQELQKKLDEISGGSFTESLESIKKPSCIVFQARNGGPAMSVNLMKQDIEQFLEYNPNDWNVFPDVTPPEGVPMRVECQGYDRTLRTCFVYKQGAWHYESGVTFKGDETALQVRRYRPWE